MKIVKALKEVQIAAKENPGTVQIVDDIIAYNSPQTGRLGYGFKTKEGRYAANAVRITFDTLKKLEGILKNVAEQSNIDPLICPHCGKLKDTTSLWWLQNRELWCKNVPDRLHQDEKFRAGNWDEEIVLETAKYMKHTFAGARGVSVMDAYDKWPRKLWESCGSTYLLLDCTKYPITMPSNTPHLHGYIIRPTSPVHEVERTKTGPRLLIDAAYIKAWMHVYTGMSNNTRYCYFHLRGAGCSKAKATDQPINLSPQALSSTAFQRWLRAR